MKGAADAGADFAMVISPGPSSIFCSVSHSLADKSSVRGAAGYFAGAMSRKAIKQFFVDVAEASPIPVRPAPRCDTALCSS